MVISVSSRGIVFLAAILSWLMQIRRTVGIMRPQSRSLNLSNAVAIVVYDAWRQLGFVGGA